MTPSDNYANYSGSRCHDTPDEELEQLHKEPELVSRSGLSVVVAAAACAATGDHSKTTATATATTSINSNGGLTYKLEKNNDKLVGDRMKQRLFGVECEADTLTSLSAHIDEVKGELGLLVNCTASIPSGRAGVITNGSSIVRNYDGCSNNLNAELQEVQRKRKLAAILIPVNQETMRDSSSESAISPSLGSSFIGGSGQYVKSPWSHGADGGGGGGGSDLHRCNSTASSCTLSELIGENLNDLLVASGAERDHLRRHQTNNTIFILQHLMQKRDELGSIDKQLFEIMKQYLVQLNLLPEQSKQSRQDGATFVPPPLGDIHELEVEPHMVQVRLALRQQKQQQQQQQQQPYATTNAPQTWSNLSQIPPVDPHEDNTNRRNIHDEVLNLSLSGTRFPSSKSSSRTILSPSAGSWQDSTESVYDSIENNNHNTSTSAMKSIASSADNYDRRLWHRHYQLIIDHQQNNSIANNNSINTNTNQTSTARKKFTANLKKSRLLGANLSDNNDRQLRTNIPPTTTTNTQQSSINNHDHGDDLPARLTQTNDRTSPLNLLKRYRTPPSPAVTTMGTTTTSATMTMSPPIASTSSTSLSSSVPKSEHQQNDKQSLRFCQGRQVIMSPIGTPEVAISSDAIPSHPIQQRAYGDLIEPRETFHTPLHKKFRSVAQMVDTCQQQILPDRHGLLSRHHEIGKTMTPLSLNSSKSFNYGPVRGVVQQTCQHSQTFSYPHHQQQQSSAIAAAAAETADNLMAQLNTDTNLGGEILNHSALDSCLNSGKQFTPLVCPVDQACYILGSGQPNGHYDDPNQMMIMANRLTDFSNTSSCNSMTVEPTHLTSQETLELMRIDKDGSSGSSSSSNDNNNHHYRHHHLLPAAQQLAPQHSHHQLPRDFHQKIIYRCHVCGSRFEDRHRLQQHLSIHLNLHPSWFEEKTIKETMARYELKRGDYLCSSCNQRSETTAEFDRHMHLHGDKPHQCELCNQGGKLVSFRYYRQLLTHLRSHCFLYSCRFVPDCKQTANRKDYLKLHILKHHLNNKLPEQYTACCH